tara:strand:+ start:86 stop:493 length:408 start_codon:yes stop_codon:yes gene_type:complete
MREIILNRIKTPDGTILISRHVHDYVEYVDKNGFTYMVDGGNDYLRRNVNEEAPYEELSLYTDTPFEEIRKHYCRGGRGINGDEPLKWVPLNEMNDGWLQACIDYNEKRGMGKEVSNKIYKKEQEYRKENEIQIN